MPSMQEAAKIFDVAKRHSYVFDNGLSSPDFFDVEKRMESEEFATIKDRCNFGDKIFEVGCFTGLNLLGLAEIGYGQKDGTLTGLDFVEGAVSWARSEHAKRGKGRIEFVSCEFDQFLFKETQDRIICYDVLEHQLNVGNFLWRVAHNLKKDGLALFLVPKGREYFDCGHVSFFPDTECLRNVLEYYFSIEETYELKSCPKLFACCKRK